MQVIQGRVARAEFAKTLGKMREWLDRNDCRLLGFETAADGIETIAVKAVFDGNDLAEAFCQAFRGFYGDRRGANQVDDGWSRLNRQS